MSGLRHQLFFIPILAAGLLLQPALALAQANEAPVPDPVFPGWNDPGFDGTIHGSATGPTATPWSSYVERCAGIVCLSAGERTELNELCKLAGDQWRDYALCEQLATSLLAPQP